MMSVYVFIRDMLGTVDLQNIRLESIYNYVDDERRASMILENTHLLTFSSWGPSH